MAGYEDALFREVEEKVAMMRRLGIAELDLSTGYARRIVLGPAPEPAPAQEAPSVAAVPAERPTDRPDPPDDEPRLTPEQKRKAKQEQRLFGAVGRKV